MGFKREFFPFLKKPFIAGVMVGTSDCMLRSASFSKILNAIFSLTVKS